MPESAANGVKLSAGRPFPWTCPQCRQKEVRPATVPYRGERLHEGRLVVVDVPDWVVPRCANCGELVINYPAEEQLLKAVREQAGEANGAGPLRNGPFSLTPYHAAYYAHELTRRSASDSIAKIGSSLFNATVDLNPHQLDAALFAFRAPLSCGAILADEVGVGLEQRIAEIYQACRSREEIDHAFSSLRAELEGQITARMADTRQKLLEHFDEEVHQRLKVELEEGTNYLWRAERWLWGLTRHELAGHAAFNERDFAFDLAPLGPGWPEPIPAGRYRFVTRLEPAEGQHAYRLGHPLAQAVVERAKARPLRTARVRFDYSGHRAKVGAAAELVGRSGWLRLSRLTVESVEDEDRMLFAALDEQGKPLHPDVAAKLFELGGEAVRLEQPSDDVARELAAQTVFLSGQAAAQIAERNGHFFEREIDKLDRWADDLKGGLEPQVKELTVQIKQGERASRLAPDLAGKLALQRQKADLERQRKEKQRKLSDSEDEIDARRNALFGEVERRLQQQATLTELFTIAWEVAGASKASWS